jgi:eukaryotic-like serine/threonine-protein kinase
VVRAGRAAVYPVYKGTFERGGSVEMRDRVGDERREWTIQFIKDVRRTMDYLQSRKDIDHSKIAFYGYSWGARIGSIVGAVEPRLATMILAHGGLPPEGRPTEVDELNFLPRVKLPVLMINGRYDHIFPVESSQKPFFQLLGTKSPDKQYVLFDGGHNAPRNDVIRVVLDWLDRYLGKV